MPKYRRKLPHTDDSPEMAILPREHAGQRPACSAEQDRRPPPHQHPKRIRVPFADQDPPGSPSPSASAPNGRLTLAAAMATDAVQAARSQAESDWLRFFDAIGNPAATTHAESMALFAQARASAVGVWDATEQALEASTARDEQALEAGSARDEPDDDATPAVPCFTDIADDSCDEDFFAQGILEVDTGADTPDFPSDVSEWGGTDSDRDEIDDWAQDGCSGVPCEGEPPEGDSVAGHSCDDGPFEEEIVGMYNGDTPDVPAQYSDSSEDGNSDYDPDEDDGSESDGWSQRAKGPMRANHDDPDRMIERTNQPVAQSVRLTRSALRKGHGAVEVPHGSARRQNHKDTPSEQTRAPAVPVIIDTPHGRRAVRVQRVGNAVKFSLVKQEGSGSSHTFGVSAHPGVDESVEQLEDQLSEHRRDLGLQMREYMDKQSQAQKFDAFEKAAKALGIIVTPGKKTSYYLVQEGLRPAEPDFAANVARYARSKSVQFTVIYDGTSATFTLRCPKGKDYEDFVASVKRHKDELGRKLVPQLQTLKGNGKRAEKYMAVERAAQSLGIDVAPGTSVVQHVAQKKRDQAPSA